MTTLNVNTIKPAGSTLNIGESGDTLVIADDVKVNTINDAGGGYKIDAFTATGTHTWTCPTGVTAAEILIVAGGGGGSAPYYAGGGGGGVVHATAYPLTAGVVYDLSVGTGGSNGNATAGGNSVFNVNGEGSNTTVLTANGGGRGGRKTNLTGRRGRGQSDGECDRDRDSPRSGPGPVRAQRHGRARRGLRRGRQRCRRCLR